MNTLYQVNRKRRAAFLARFRSLEPSIRESVRTWVAMDIRRAAEQQRARDLNMPVEGFVSLPVPLPRVSRAKDPIRNKRSVYITGEAAEEMRTEAKRIGINLSELMRHVWVIAAPTMKARRMPPTIDPRPQRPLPPVHVRGA